jgi:hypothetical protein
VESADIDTAEVIQLDYATPQAKRPPQPFPRFVMIALIIVGLMVVVPGTILFLAALIHEPDNWAPTVVLIVALLGSSWWLFKPSKRNVDDSNQI